MLYAIAIRSTHKHCTFKVSEQLSNCAVMQCPCSHCHVRVVNELMTMPAQYLLSRELC